MKVDFVGKDKVAFSTLKYGDVFLLNGVYYMKFYYLVHDNVNTVRLDGLDAMSLMENTLVTPVDGRFMVKG